MRILDYLSAGTVKVPMNCTSKHTIVEELSSLLAAEGKIPDKDAFVAAVMKREELMSTTVLEGVAIPHAKLETISAPCVAIGVCPMETACLAQEADAVRIVFLIASSPKDAGAQLKILAALARYLKAPDFIPQLEHVHCPEDVLNLFRKFEAFVRL